MVVVQTSITTRNPVWMLQKILNIEMPYNLDITFMGTYPRNNQVLIAILFRKARKQDKPRCSSIEQLKWSFTQLFRKINDAICRKININGKNPTK